MKDKIQKMMKDLNKILDNYEDRMPRIKGVGNLSRGDVEMMVYKLETMLKGPYHFMKELDEKIITVFNKFGVDPEYNNMEKYSPWF